MNSQHCDKEQFIDSLIEAVVSELLYRRSLEEPFHVNTTILHHTQQRAGIYKDRALFHLNRMLPEPEDLSK